MSVLAEVLSSRIRAEIFRILFGVRDLELHGRELARQSGFNEAATRQELRKLARLDLVVSRRAGNRVYYRAHREHPLYPEVHRIVLKTVGLVDVISRALSDSRVDLSFVFGSVAEGSVSATSDVDLLVIADLSLRELVSLLSGVAESIGREINPHIMSKEEYCDRCGRGDHFVTHVISGQKIFIIGSQDDLEAMGRVRLAQG